MNGSSIDLDFREKGLLFYLNSGKLFGLTIDREHLPQIRAERYSRGRYAELRQCQYEVSQAEAMYRRERMPFINTTAKSVEEISTTIVHRANLDRDLM